MFDQALVQQLCVRLAWVSNNRHLMLEGARPHMNDVRVINESRAVLGFVFPFYLSESNSKTTIKNLEMIGADMLFV